MVTTILIRHLVAEDALVHFGRCTLGHPRNDHLSVSQRLSLEPAWRFAIQTRSTHPDRFLHRGLRHVISPGMDRPFNPLRHHDDHRQAHHALGMGK